MIGILLVFQVVVAIALIGIVLLQRSDSDGTGLGGGGGGLGVMSSRGKANAMTRATAILAAVFMLNCIVLNILSRHTGSITDRIEAGKVISNEPTATTTPIPGTKTPDGRPATAKEGATAPAAPAASPPAKPAPLAAPAAK